MFTSFRLHFSFISFVLFFWTFQRGFFLLQLFSFASKNTKLAIYLHRKVNRMKYSFQYINIKFKIQFWKALKKQHTKQIAMAQVSRYFGLFRSLPLVLRSSHLLLFFLCVSLLRFVWIARSIPLNLLYVVLFAE